MLRLERDDPLEVSIGLLGLILVDPGDPVVGPGRVLSDRLDKEPILPSRAARLADRARASPTMVSPNRASSAAPQASMSPNLPVTKAL